MVFNTLKRRGNPIGDYGGTTLPEVRTFDRPENCLAAGKFMEQEGSLSGFLGNGRGGLGRVWYPGGARVGYRYPEVFLRSAGSAGDESLPIRGKGMCGSCEDAAKRCQDSLKNFQNLRVAFGFIVCLDADGPDPTPGRRTPPKERSN